MLSVTVPALGPGNPKPSPLRWQTRGLILPRAGPVSVCGMGGTGKLPQFNLSRAKQQLEGRA